MATLAIILLVAFNVEANVTAQKDIYTVKEISAIVSIPDGYDVFSKDNTVSDEVLKRHNVERDKLEYLISVYNADLWMFPENEIYPADFQINIKVKEKDAYKQIDDLRKWSFDDRSDLVEAFLTGTGANKYEYYETESALFYKADWFINGHPEQRYASIVDGKMLYIYSSRENGALTEKDRSDLKYVVDHFVIDKPNPVSDSSSSFQSNTAFAVLSALSKTTVQGGIILALFAIVAAISFRSSRKPKQHKTETENKEK